MTASPRASAAGNPGGGDVAELAVAFGSADLSMELLRDTDRPLYVRLYTDDRVMRHVAPALSAESAGSAFRLVMERMARSPPASLYWTVRCRSRRMSFGILALIFDRKGASAEIGILLDPSMQGGGHAPEAIAALADRLFRWQPGFLLRTHHQPDHPAVPRVLRKLGFAPDGIDRGQPRWRLDGAAWLGRHSAPSFATAAD